MLRALREAIALGGQLRGTYLYAFLVPVVLLVIGGLLFLNSLDSAIRSTAIPMVLGFMILGIVVSFLFSGWMRKQELQAKHSTHVSGSSAEPSPPNPTPLSQPSVSSKEEVAQMSTPNAVLPSFDFPQGGSFMSLTLTQRNNLIAYLEKTSLVENRNAQISLCEAIGLKWRSLGFVGEAPHIFSVRLVNYLNDNGKASQLQELYSLLKGEENGS